MGYEYAFLLILYSLKFAPEAQYGEQFGLIFRFVFR